MVFEKIKEIGVVPVISIEDEKDALYLADALLQGGLPIAEITFRTKAAAAVIQTLAEKRSELLVGAGTVLSVEQLIKAKEAGAKFGLAPGFDSEIVTFSQKKKLPFAPGVMTPSEIQAAIKLGCKVMKFFPAKAAGGPAMLKSIAAPFTHLGVQFNPTGGVTQDNLKSWLDLDVVVAVGGTWIATKEDIANGNWNSITEKAKQVVSLVQEIRGE